MYKKILFLMLVTNYFNTFSSHSIDYKKLYSMNIEEFIRYIRTVDLPDDERYKLTQECKEFHIQAKQTYLNWLNESLQNENKQNISLYTNKAATHGLIAAYLQNEMNIIKKK